MPRVRPTTLASVVACLAAAVMLKPLVAWTVVGVVWLVGELPRLSAEEAASVQGYGQAVQAILTVVLAPITIFAAWMARNAWVAARHQREDSLMPVLTAELVDGKESVAAPHVILRNIGVGPALDVRPTIVVVDECQIEYFADIRDGQPGNVRNHIGAGESVEFSFVERRLLDGMRDREKAVMDLTDEVRRLGEEGSERFATEKHRLDFMISNNTKINDRIIQSIESEARDGTCFNVEYCDVYRRPFCLNVLMRVSPPGPSSQKPVRRYMFAAESHEIPSR